MLVFFDWVGTPLNRNIGQATVRDRLIGDVIHVPVGLLVLVALHQQRRWVVLAGAIWCSVVLLVGIVNWWVPWLTGVRWREITEETYQREYAGNVTMLPRLTRSSIRPDVQHILIHVAVLAASVTSWVSFFNTP